MKTLINILLNALKWIAILLILLFALATFMGRSYLQTSILVAVTIAMAYWPKQIKERWNKRISTIGRLSFIVLFLIAGFTLFQTEPKTSIYQNEDRRNELMAVYDEQTKYWPLDTEDRFIDTKYGKVHVLVCGADTNPPLIMIHAASMGAHSWAENLELLIDHYRIYSVDNIGEGNKSELDDALVFPANGKEIAGLYATIADSLNIESSPVLGASNGGFVAMNYAFHYPERVKSLLLFGPMGLTPLSNQSIMMLSISIMYPFQFIRDYVTSWAIGEDEYVLERYGKWFDCIQRGTMPSVSKPVPMTTMQKKSMEMPVLLFLGTKDPIVGDASVAKDAAKDFPCIQIETLKSGHLVSVECRDFVNNAIAGFLGIE